MTHEDCAAVDLLLRRYVRRYMFSTDPVATVEDLIQTAWLRGLPRLDSIPTNRERAAFLFRIAKNALTDHLRGRHIRRQRTLVDNWDTTPDFADVAIDGLLGEAAMAEAPPAVRLIGLGYTTSEVGESLGIPANTVKTQAFRWRKKHPELHPGEL